MKRLLLALTSVFVASGAYAAPMTFGFFQGGYEENAFVAGYFVAEDGNHDGFISHVHFDSESGGGGEVLDYHMLFSGNSLFPALSHHGLGALGRPAGETDFTNMHGIFFDTRGSTIPVGNSFPPGCNPFDPLGAEDCTAFPIGFMSSHNRAEKDDRVIWRAGFIIINSTTKCTDFYPVCGAIGTDAAWLLTVSTERIHVFRISEPHPLSLIAIGLVGLALIRRRA